MTSESPAQRLGRLVRERRKELKLTQADVQEAGGPSTATLRLIEGGKHTDFRSSTSGPLDKVLQWQPGSIDHVLAGGEPTPLTDLYVTERAERLLEKVASGEVSPSREDLRQVGGFLASHGRRAVLNSAMAAAASAAAQMGRSLLSMVDAAAKLQLAQPDRDRLERVRADVALLDRVVSSVLHIPEVMDAYSVEIQRALSEVQQVIMRSGAFNQPEVVATATSESFQAFSAQTAETTRILTEAAQRVRRIDEEVAQLEGGQDGLESASQSDAPPEEDEGKKSPDELADEGQSASARLGAAVDVGRPKLQVEDISEDA